VATPSPASLQLDFSYGEYRSVCVGAVSCVTGGENKHLPFYPGGEVFWTKRVQIRYYKSIELNDHLLLPQAFTSCVSITW
jgi:hypothetical protein